MISLIYISSAARLFSDAQILAPLERSRLDNGRLGITAMLLDKEGCFIQLLEGDDEVVKTLFRKIFADRRHSGVSLLLRESIEQRDFPE